MVETVLGNVPADTLGPTLAHEHVISVTPEIQRDFPDLSWQGSREHAIQQTVDALSDVADRGIKTIVDCTTIDHGRDIEALLEANKRVPINIIAATGLYTHDKLPFFYKFRPERELKSTNKKDIIEEMFLQDILTGIQGTTIKAGVIKVTTDSEGVTPNIERILRAAARTHNQTGTPITTHTNVKHETGLGQLEIFKEEGVDLSRVVIGHSGDSSDLDYLRKLLDSGVFIGADRFGFYRPGEPDLEAKARTVVALCKEGYAEQILLSHDTAFYVDWWEETPPPWAPDWIPTHISDIVLPKLLEEGVSEEQIDTMMGKNAARLFANK